MNGYIAIFNGKKVEILAATKWAAVEQARVALKVPKSKFGLLAVELAEVAGAPVVHVAVN